MSHGLNRTDIEWVKNVDGSRGFSLNPFVGCHHWHQKDENGHAICAVGSDCWAKGQAPRGHKACGGFEPHVHWERLEALRHRQKPAVIFMADLADPFGSFYSLQDRLRLIHTIAMHPDHICILLTKWPQGMLEVQEQIDGGIFPPNAWLGVSICRDYDTYKMELLDKVNATVKIVSIEPMLERLPNLNLDYGAGVDWVIIGGKTGHHPFTPELEWVTEIMKRTEELEIPTFLKNNLAALGGEISYLSTHQYDLNGDEVVEVDGVDLLHQMPYRWHELRV